MAFHVVTGVMGSGKSYMGAELCIQAAKEGAVIHTNLPLNLDWWEAQGWKDKVIMLPDDMREWIKFENRNGKEIPVSDILVGGVEGRENIMVVDEASLLFDIDDQMKNRAANKPVFQLVALCRHAGLDLYFLAQHQANVDAKLRRMAETRTKCIKTERIPFVGWLAAPFFGTFRRVVFMGEGTLPFAKTWHRFKQEVGDSYRTHGMKESLGLKIEATRKAKGADDSKKKGITMLALVILGLVGSFGYAFYHFASYKADLEQNAKPKNGAPGVPGASPTSGPAVPAQAPKTKPKAGWRVAEWEEEDEHILALRVTNEKGPTIYTRSGLRLFVGGFYEGEPIVECVPWGGWFYFRTQFGRLVAVRPLRWSERQELDPVTVQGQRRSGETPDLVSPAVDVVESNIKRMTR